MTITHVIFDMDGVIVDSESIYTQVLNQLVDRYDKKYTYDLKRNMMGMKMETAMEYLVDYLKLPVNPEELTIEYKRIFEQDVWKDIKLLPGIEEFILKLSRNKIPIAIATGSNTSNFHLKTRNYKNLISLFHHVVLGDDKEIKVGKPDPEVYEIARKRFSDNVPNSENCLVIEDSINGTISGCLAEMKVLWIPDPSEPEGLPEELEKFSDKIERLSSIKDFEPGKYGMKLDIQ